MPDYDALNHYVARRYPPWRATASRALKRLMPLTLLARRAVAAEPADVVLVHPHAAAAARHAPFARALAQRRLAVREEVVPDVGGLLRSRRLSVPSQGWRDVPREWRLQAGFAAWVAQRYRPKVLVTFMDDSLHSPFLREAVEAGGGVVVNVAHAMCWPNMDFSMCDFHWFLLWGQRSFENLTQAPVRFGNCRTLTVGSIYLQQLQGASPRTDGRLPRVLWIGQDLASAQGDALRRDALAFARATRAQRRYEVHVREHPLDRGQLRRLLRPILPEARWSDPSVPLSVALSGMDVAASSFSSGLVDAAALGIPVIAFSTTGLERAIGLHEHGLPVLSDEAQVDPAIQALLADHGRASDAARRLAQSHLYRLDDASGRCAEIAECLANRGDPATLGYPCGFLERKHPWAGN